MPSKHTYTVVHVTEKTLRGNSIFIISAILPLVSKPDNFLFGKISQSSFLHEDKATSITISMTKMKIKSETGNP